MSKFSFLNNNWIVTLTATLIGVFAALYLNEIVASRKLNQQKVIATKNIFQEIKQNRESLEVSIKKLEIMLGTIVFMNERMQENGEFISSVDSLAIFKEKYPGVFQATDSTKVENGKYNYDGEVFIDFNLTHINLTTASLKTLKSSGLASTYDFDCLMNLERLEKFTNETLQKESRSVEKFYDAMKSDKSEDLKAQISILISYEKALLTWYQDSESTLKNCG